MQNQQHSLKRCFGMREAVTITTGTVIGVGLFTVGAAAAGTLGSSVIFATLLALAVSIYPALLYAEMGAALPYAGGTYQYASAGLGRPAGMLAGWCFIISMVSVASGEALAFSFYLRTLLEAVGLNLPVSDTMIAAAAIIGFTILNIRGVQISGRLQNGFLFFFWGVAIVWVITMIPSMNFSGFSTLSNGISLRGFLPCAAMVWWCFAGFETCCAMGEEIRYPQINIPRAMFLAPFIVFAVSGLFQWVLVCIVPAEGLSSVAAAAAPYAQAMKQAGVIGFPLILLCAGIAFGGDFSTLNACVSAPARYLFTMARDRVLPKLFSHVHNRWNTPYIAVGSLGILMLALVCTGSIDYIASLSLFATLLYYIIGICASVGLRRRYPELKRAYRAPLIFVGAPVSIVIYLLMMTQLDHGAVVAGLIWCAIGLLLYIICSRYYRVGTSYVLPALAQEEPSEVERRKMDREYRLWKGITIVAVLLVLALFCIAFLF